MYGQKKSGMTWMTQIFLGVSVLVLVGAIAFGIIVSRNGGITFNNTTSGDANNPFALSK